MRGKLCTLTPGRNDETHHVAEEGHIELEHKVEAVRPLDLADPTTFRSILQQITDDEKSRALGKMDTVKFL